MSTQTAPKIKFNNKKLVDFYPELRKRVDNYFKENNISPHANTTMIVKTVFIMGMFLATYLLIVADFLNPWVMLALAGINGFTVALIGLNIAHDAIHGAYSKNNTVNKLLGVTLNIAGANDYLWKIKHNIIHHTFTNIPHHDDDIDQVKLIRLNPDQPLYKIHKYQHIYAFFLYPFATLSWVFTKDFTAFFKSKIASYETRNHPRIELIRLFAFKIFYYFFFLAVPLIAIDLPWYYIILGFVFAHIVEGMTLSLVFQLAHVIEETHFPQPDENGLMENNWAVHQMYTTANFSMKSKLALFICGGLNFQVEHHLFSKICHIHYPAIAPIVEKTAKEYGLPYIYHTTFFSALHSHVKFMKRNGKAAPISSVQAAA